MTVLGGGTLGGDQVTNVKPLRRGLCVLSCLPTLCDPVDYIACQDPLCVGFSRQEYWVGCHAFLQDLPDPGIKPVSFKSPALAGRFFTTSAAWESASTLIMGFRPQEQ